MPCPRLAKPALALAFLLGAASLLYSQALPTASRVGDAQIGAGYSFADPDYVHQTFQGFTVYGDFDFRTHFGAEAEFHQVNSTNGDQSFERTYLVGGRYFRTYGALLPYVKAMIGRGQFEYPTGQTELAYTLYAVAVGADFNLGPSLRIRGEYEFQSWTNFPNGGFTPQIVTIGVAYHFAGKPRRR